MKNPCQLMTSAGVATLNCLGNALRATFGLVFGRKVAVTNAGQFGADEKVSVKAGTTATRRKDVCFKITYRDVVVSCVATGLGLLAASGLVVLGELSTRACCRENILAQVQNEALVSLSTTVSVGAVFGLGVFLCNRIRARAS